MWSLREHSLVISTVPEANTAKPMKRHLHKCCANGSVRSHQRSILYCSWATKICLLTTPALCNQLRTKKTAKDLQCPALSGSLRGTGLGRDTSRPSIAVMSASGLSLQISKQATTAALEGTRGLGCGGIDYETEAIDATNIGTNTPGCICSSCPM